jgi:hypothetical protein
MEPHSASDSPKRWRLQKHPSANPRTFWADEVRRTGSQIASKQPNAAKLHETRSNLGKLVLENI